MKVSTLKVAGIAYAGLLVFHIGLESYRGYLIRKKEEEFKKNVNINRKEALKKRYSPLKILGRFANPFKEYRRKTFTEFILWNLFVALRGPVWGNESRIPTEKELETILPVEPTPIDLFDINLNPLNKNKILISWIGQSCVLCRIGNFVFLTDPFFADELIPGNILSPQRLRPKPCCANKLPKLDAVIISHDHPDHLDMEAVKDIADSQKDNKNLNWIVPLGVGEILTKYGNLKSQTIKELSWWDSINLHDMKNNNENNFITITCTPSMHWSGRGLFDTNKTLWSSFYIKHNNNGGCIFHAGDTGYVSELFQTIREIIVDKDMSTTTTTTKTKTIDGLVSVALVPCGSFKPRWHLKVDHANPYEAVQIGKCVKANHIIGVHWGTLLMTDEAYTDPAEHVEEYGGHVLNMIGGSTLYEV